MVLLFSQNVYKEDSREIKISKAYRMLTAGSQLCEVGNIICFLLFTDQEAEAKNVRCLNKAPESMRVRGFALMPPLHMQLL